MNGNAPWSYPVWLRVLKALFSLACYFKSTIQFSKCYWRIFTKCANYQQLISLKSICIHLVSWKFEIISYSPIFQIAADGWLVEKIMLKKPGGYKMVVRISSSPTIFLMLPHHIHWSNPSLTIHEAGEGLHIRITSGFTVQWLPTVIFHRRCEDAPFVNLGPALPIFIWYWFNSWSWFNTYSPSAVLSLVFGSIGHENNTVVWGFAEIKTLWSVKKHHSIYSSRHNKKIRFIHSMMYG